MQDLEIIGRKQEIQTLTNILNSQEAEFVAVYGRRRIGKTFLIKNLLQNKCDLYFEVSGLHGGTLFQQLANFQLAISKTFYNGTAIRTLKNWRDAFEELVTCINRVLILNKAKKKFTLVLFIDELPWLSTAKSNFITYLDYYWNTKLSQISQLKLIVCGSAASWMIKKLINNKGGLHNRVTKFIKLKPFNLAETKKYLNHHKIQLTDRQYLQIYMTLGGVPFYLKQLEKNKSYAENINSICFSEQGVLQDEFSRLFSSLFGSSGNHTRIAEFLATKNSGYTKSEIATAELQSSGGGLKSTLNELEEAGFIAGYSTIYNKKKDVLYRIIDEFTIFYFKWMQKRKDKGWKNAQENWWLKQMQTPQFAIWSGLAFEAVCLKHVKQIQKKLGLNHILYDVGNWRFLPKKGDSKENGAQIDLIFDREDDCINICEIKFTKESFKIEKKYSDELRNKISVFAEKTRTKKKLFLTLICTNKFVETKWSEDLVSQVIMSEDLFED